MLTTTAHARLKPQLTIKNFTISYIISTKNRLPFLKILFDQFILYCEPDEEIVVVDGNSTDGSKEFLQDLYTQGRIHQYVSEADKNQAHGWNKGFLLANGVIIKKLIDDDVHSLSAIRHCKNFMLKNPQVDICISNCFFTDLITPEHIRTASRYSYYEAWKNGRDACFSFSDVYMLIRRSALSYLGLFDTQFNMIDWEYSLRCSFLNAHIAYYTGYNALTVGTPGNVTSSTNAAVLKREGKIGKIKYGYKGDRSDISLFSEAKIAIGKMLASKTRKNSSNFLGIDHLNADKLVDIYDYLYKYLEEQQIAGSFEFIGK